MLCLSFIFVLCVYSFCTSGELKGIISEKCRVFLKEIYHSLEKKWGNKSDGKAEDEWDNA